MFQFTVLLGVSLWIALATSLIISSFVVIQHAHTGSSRSILSSCNWEIHHWTMWHPKVFLWPTYLFYLLPFPYVSLLTSLFQPTLLSTKTSNQPSGMTFMLVHIHFCWNSGSLLLEIPTTHHYLPGIEWRSLPLIPWITVASRSPKS